MTGSEMNIKTEGMKTMQDVNEQISNKDYFISLFNNNQENLNGTGPVFMNNVRKKALDNFKSLGFPGKKHEKYKYTNLEPVFNKTFNYHFSPQNITFNVEDIFKCDIPELDTHVIILLNGFYYEKFNSALNLPPGVILDSFSSSETKYPDLMKKHFAKYAGYDKDGLVALNTAFVNDGIFVYVPGNVIIEKPIQIVNLLLSQEEILVQHRNLFIFDNNSKANFIICDHTLSPHNYLTNSVTEIFAGPGAQIDLVRMQNEHNSSTQVTNTHIHQKKDSQVTTNTITLHGGLVRNNVNVELAEPGAENNTFGMYLLDHGQHVDNYIDIHHSAPYCTSNQLYKGILDDFSTGAFNGRIYVKKDAQKTMAYQTNRNLLLTNDARMNSKPQLEIYADDVKCSHGATVGQLNADAMFYLRSRGIPLDEARLLMMYAFTDEITGKIKTAPLKERVEELIHKRLKGELTRCHDCALHCC